MPVPAFTRQTAITDVSDERPFAMIGTDALPHIRRFGARNWFVFSALLLRSDAAGLAEVTLPELCDDTQLNRDTLQVALNDLCALVVEGRRILRKVPAQKFGANRYVLFPGRPDAPLADVPDLPAPGAKAAKAGGFQKKPAAPAPVPAAPPAAPEQPAPPAARPRPSRFAEHEEEGDAADFSATGNPSGGKSPLFTGPQVAEKTGHLGGASSGDFPLHFEKGYRSSTLGETDGSGGFRAEEGRSASVPASPAGSPERPRSEATPPKPKRTPPARNTQNPACAADCVALFTELYADRYEGRKPTGNIGALGQRFATALKAGTPVAEVAAAVRYYFDTSHGNAAHYARKEHAPNWLVYKFAEIAAFGSGRVKEARQFQQDGEKTRRNAQDAALLKQAQAAGEDDYLPDYLREMSEGTTAAEDYSALFANDPDPAETPAHEPAKA